MMNFRTKAKKTLLILLRQSDRDWAIRTLKEPLVSNLTVIAVTPESCLLAESLQIDYEDVRHLSFNIDKQSVDDLARNLAYNIFHLPAFMIFVGSLMQFNQYPVADMHLSLLSMSLLEIIYSWKVSNLILDLYKPDCILINWQPSPFGLIYDRLYPLTGSAGTDYHSLIVAASQRGIRINSAYPTLRKNLTSLIKRLSAAARYIKAVSQSKTIVFTYKDQAKNSHKDVLLNNVCDGYYFSSLQPLIRSLLEDNYDVNIRFSSDISPIVSEDLCPESLWIQTEYKPTLYRRTYLILSILCRYVLIHLSLPFFSVSPEYRAISTDSDGCFSLVALPAIRREAVSAILKTNILLSNSDEVFRRKNFSLVISQFDLHPDESCSVLSARRFGSKTIGLSHGLVSCFGLPRNNFASEHHCVTGVLLQNILIKHNISKKDYIHVFPDYRGIEADTNESKVSIKKRFGFKQDLPLCIFCDNSGWKHTHEKRYSDIEQLCIVKELRRVFPELQVYIRSHHGSDDTLRKSFVRNVDDPLVFFNSSSPKLAGIRFHEVVHCADVTVTSFSTSIVESLYAGVPVVYLAIYSIRDTIIEELDCLRVAQSADTLVDAIRSYLTSPLSNHYVRARSWKFLNSIYSQDKVDLYSFKILARSILEEKHSSICGSEDWLFRIRLLSQLSTSTTNATFQ